MFKVLIACYDKWDTLAEVPFMLKNAGCQVDVYCGPNSWLLSNNYHDQWLPSQPGLDEFRDGLMDIVRQSSYDWVILGDDPLIKYMNEVVGEDLFTKILPLTKIENRYMLSSKEGFSRFCVTHDITTPGYAIYNNKKDLEIIRGLTFPVINKLDFSWGGTDMFISHSIEEFESRLDQIPENQNVLIQEYITGEEVRTDSLFFNGELVSYFSARVLEHTKNIFSYTTRRAYLNDTSLEKDLINLGRKLGLNGFANITYLVDHKTGKNHLIEVDPRPNSWMPLSRYIGGNSFTNGVKRIISGEFNNGFPGMQMKSDKVELSLFYKDIRRVLWNKDRKGLARWIFNLNGYWRFIPTYDMKLTRRIIREVWNEVFMYKWKRLTGQIKD